MQLVLFIAMTSSFGNVLSDLASGVARHLAVPTKSSHERRSKSSVDGSLCLAADASGDVAATGVVKGSRKTLRRRQLRNTHRDRVQQAVFIVECQLRGLRREIASIREGANCTAKWDRRTLLSLRPTSLLDSTHAGVAANQGTTCSRSSSVDRCGARKPFSNQQEEFLLDFTKATMTPVAEMIAERFEHMLQIIDQMTAKVDEQASVLQSITLRPSFETNYYEDVCLGSNSNWQLNPDAMEFKPSGRRDACSGDVCAGNQAQGIDADYVADSIQFLLSMGAKCPLARYHFTKSACDKRSQVHALKKLVQQADTRALKADLYDGCKFACISFERNGKQDAISFDVTDRAQLLLFLQERQVKITSHFDMTRRV